MKRTRSLTCNILSLLILGQLFAVSLMAQNELVKPGKMDEATFARLQEMIQYNDPDSALVYRPGNDTVPYMKLYFRYNRRHQPVVEDRLQKYGDRYRIKQITIRTYDPATAKLRKEDIMVGIKSRNDSIATPTVNMFVYDSIGNLVLRYAVDTLEGKFRRANSDSMIYHYDQNGVATAETTYFFGFVGSSWIRDKIYKTKNLGDDVNPEEITLSIINTENQLTPVSQFKNITWAKPCNSFEGIDTLANEYTLAYFYDGKWADRYKKVSTFNALGKVDSSITYILKGGIPYPGEKDVYTYQGGLAPAKLHYEYMNGQWQLTAGTRCTLSFGDDGNGRYSLILKDEVYEKGFGAGGKWKEQDRALWK